MNDRLARIERLKFFTYVGVFLAGTGLIGLVCPYPWAVFLQGLFVAFFSYKPLKSSWRGVLVIVVIVGSMWYIASNVMGFSDMVVWRVAMLASVTVGAVLIPTIEIAKKRN